jgi:hypothetical protein
MYNQNLKKTFSNELPSYGVLEQYFKRSEAFENKYGCDIGEMSCSQLEETLKHTFASVPKKNYLIHFKHRLKKYSDWYSERMGVESVRPNVDYVFRKISNIGAENFFDVPKKIYFLNVRHMILELNRISCDEGSLLVKSAEILAWYGLEEDDMLSMKRSDIGNGVIYHNGREIKIDRYSAEILEEFRDAEEYAVPVNCGQGVMYYANSPYLFRKRGRKPFDDDGSLKKQNLRCSIAEFSGHSNYEFGLNHTRINGLMSRAYIKEWEGDLPDCKGFEYYEMLFQVKMKRGSFENLISEYETFKKYVKATS